jgi:hypothetical protein
MTQDEAKQTAELQNRFDPDIGCPFKSACIRGKCPAYIPTTLVQVQDELTWDVVSFGCKIVRGLEKLAEM